ncbi:hypothetical protein B0T10DRAFT_575901, partial [Thelonectria olida]
CSKGTSAIFSSKPTALCVSIFFLPYTLHPFGLWRANLLPSFRHTSMNTRTPYLRTMIIGPPTTDLGLSRMTGTNLKLGALHQDLALLNLLLSLPRVWTIVPKAFSWMMRKRKRPRQLISLALVDSSCLTTRSVETFFKRS